MPLQKIKIPIAFQQGIDSKVDAYQESIGAMADVINGVFTKAKRINKRFGYDILSTTLLDTSNITIGNALSSFKDELNLFTNNKIHTYIESIERWQEKGTIVSTKNTITPIIRNDETQSNPDIAHNQGITAFTWEDSRGDLRYSIIDEDTGSFIISDAQLNSSGSLPKVIAIGNSFYFIYIDTNVIDYKKVDLTNLTNLPSAITLTSNIDPVNQIYDIINIDNRIIFVYNSANSSGGIALRYITSTGIISSEKEIIGESADTSISLYQKDDTELIAVYYDSTGPLLRLIRYDSDLTQLDAPTTLSTDSNIRNILIAKTTSSTYRVIWEVSNGTASNYILNYQDQSFDTYSAGSTTELIRSVGLASKSFTYNDNTYFLIVHESAPQDTYFLADISGNIISKITPGNSGGITNKPVLPSVELIDTGIFRTCTQIKSSLASDVGYIYTNLGINSVKIDFISKNNFRSSESANNLHIVGGTLQMYDGASVVEHGYHLFPEIQSVSDNGAGLLDSGSYQYQAVYEWIDNYGQTHRSAPAIAKSINLAASHQTQVIVSTLRLSQKNNIKIVLYRTEANGTILYKVAETDNDKTINTVTFSDNAADSTIIDNQIIYTTGGILDNIGAPSNSIITNFNNRLFLAGLEDKNLIQYSKQITTGSPVEFNDTLTIKLDNRGQEVTSLAPLDDKLVIFKKRAIFVINGDGPNNLGEQNSFSAPTLVTTDVGCNNPNSVVSTPIGLMFKSEKGIYLLDRSLQTSYIGSSIEDFNDLLITSGTLLSDVNEIRFTTQTGRTLVYNYFFQQWTTFTNLEAEDAIIWKDSYALIKSNGEVFIENRSKFTDGTSKIEMEIETAWISADDIQGYQRIYSLHILGTFFSDHMLHAQVAYNFNPTYVQEKYIDTSVLTTNKYGEGSPYGSGDEIYGGAYPLYQFRLFTKKQKCQSFKLKLSDVQSATLGEAWSISHVVIKAGLKQNTFKQEQSKSFGLKE